MSDFTNPYWRLNNLYKIKDKAGQVVTFRMNWAQKLLYKNMHFLNVVLKARQLGCTSFIQIFMLDRALFNDHTNCGIVAHNKEDAELFFRDKIKFAYDHLPGDLRNALRATSDTTRSLTFSNGSTIRVGTSMRSGTYQYIHISEMGKICAKFPDKAEEVITGTLNTIAPGQIAFIESTAEGPFGEFYDMCKTAEDLTMAVDNGQIEFTPLDWKFHFFPWWQHPDYELTQKVEISEKLLKYFYELEHEQGIKLAPKKKYWYAKKQAEQGDKMKQEYPSTSAEAFEKSMELAIYGKQLRQARKDQRICKLPVERSVPVNSYWDLGHSDNTAIWLAQHFDNRHHFIYYFEGRLENLAYYVDQLFQLRDEYGWYYGVHYLPHDVAVTDISEIHNRTRREVLQDAGLRPIQTVPKIRNLSDGIELTRRIFDQCWFDEEGCELGLRSLHGYEWLYDELHKTTRSTPAPNWARHGADAFRQFAQGYRNPTAAWSAQLTAAGVDGGSDRQYARNRSRHNSATNPTYNHLV